jgi:4-hydroxy-tetrahydrodipicolinate synthase
MLTAQTLEGTFTALITPFSAAGEIDFQSLSSHIERQLDAGINGLVPCGTTGEAATMSAAEQAEVITVCVELAAGRVPVIAGVGAMATDRSCALAAAAVAAGADGLLLVTPPYNKPSRKGLIAHFEAVAAAAPGCPIVLYNVPGRTAFDADVDCVAAICAAVPSVIGIKEATGDMERAAQLQAHFGADLALLSGDDFSLLPFYAVGGRGAISVVSNIMPRLTAAVYQELCAGDLAAAQRAYRRLRPLCAELFATVNPVPVKMSASILGWCEPNFRLPLVAMDDAECTALRAALTAARRDR